MRSHYTVQSLICCGCYRICVRLDTQPNNGCGAHSPISICRVSASLPTYHENNSSLSNVVFFSIFFYYSFSVCPFNRILYYSRAAFFSCTLFSILYIRIILMYMSGTCIALVLVRTLFSSSRKLPSTITSEHRRCVLSIQITWWRIYDNSAWWHA